MKTVPNGNDHDNDNISHAPHGASGDPNTSENPERLTGAGKGSQEQTQAANTPDPFDPASLRLSQDFASTLGVKKHILTIPIRKPAKEWWVRVHPDPDYQTVTTILELKEDREIYLVVADLRDALAAESTFGVRRLCTAMNRQGVPFIWPLRLPGPDGRIDDWSATANKAADMASRRWIRISANMSVGAYDVFESTADIPDPNWPEMPFQEILRIAFKGHVIDDLNHPVLRRLRGEA